MGIRKHFEKKSSNEDLKLQDLSLEQEKNPELKFDPETEVTESDWQGMKDRLEFFRTNNEWWDFAYQAMCMKILAPDKFSNLSIIDGRAWQEMKQLLEAERKNNHWYDKNQHYQSSNWNEFVKLATYIKIIAPGIFSELSIQDWQAIKQGLEADRIFNSWHKFTDQAMSIKILAPDKSSELNIDDQAWQGMKQQLEKDRNTNWSYFSDQAMSMKILAPDRFSKINIDDPVWQGMKRRLEKARKDKNGFAFAFHAMCMKILAADKVEITDQGLEITMHPPESFKQEKKPRPERRQF